MDEFSWIDAFRTALSSVSPASPHGIGDDAALLPSTAQARVIATDMMVEGVHFRRGWSSLADVAYKLYASNASDMWAMGAAPAQWLLSVGFSDAPGADHATWLAEGFLSAMDSWGQASLIGGDTTHADALTLSVTMIGVCDQAPWTRTGFRPGDRLWVDGVLGLSSAGLALLAAGHRDEDSAVGACVRQHLRPQKQYSEMPTAAYGGIDISDGLTADLMHAARASNVRMVIDQALPGRKEVRAAAAAYRATDDSAARDVADGADEDTACTAQQDAWQLGGGEDYVRVIGAPQCPGKGWTAIGFVEDGPPSVFDERDGARQELSVRGWNHFRSTTSST